DLIRHDAEHGTHFAPTLRAWLRSQGHPAGAAELLDVHPHALRNRIRRMGEHTRLGLDDPQLRLAPAIALEICVQDDRNHGRPPGTLLESGARAHTCPVPRVRRNVRSPFPSSIVRSVSVTVGCSRPYR